MLPARGIERHTSACSQAIPSTSATLRLIELNGAAIESNKQSFLWGRLAAVEPEKVIAAAIPASRPESQRLSESLDELIDRRRSFLTDYQDAAYAKRYADLVAKVRAAEAAKQPGSTDLTEAVARYYFKLLAIKDEYEVARLYAETDFAKRVADQFEGDYKLVFHLAPPTLDKPERKGAEPRKSTYGPWMMTAFRVLAKMRRLRGGALDVFGRTAERRHERALIGEYETLVDEVLTRLSPQNYELAVSLASVPEYIRGYGHVRQRHLKDAKAREAALLGADQVLHAAQVGLVQPKRGLDPQAGHRDQLLVAHRLAMLTDLAQRAQRVVPPPVALEIAAHRVGTLAGLDDQIDDAHLLELLGRVDPAAQHQLLGARAVEPPA